MRKEKNNFVLLVTVAVLVLLSACSGGGGDSGFSGGTGTTTVSGSVFASSVSGARVSAKNMSGQTIAGPVTTAADGSYNINIPTASLSADLRIESDGGTFTDEATGAATTAGVLAAYIPGGSLGAGSSVHIAPSTTIISHLVTKHGKTVAEARTIFAAAYGYMPDPSIAPKNAPSSVVDGSDAANRLAGFRAGVFSQLTKDMGLASDKQFDLLSALGQDLADDGKLNGSAGAVNGTHLPADIQNRYDWALHDFHKDATRNLTGLNAAEAGLMVRVDGGTFTIGDDTNAKAKPAHPVTVASFYLAKFELTFDEFDAFSNATGLPLVVDTFGMGRGNRSLYNISWYDAVEYCNWRSVQEGLTPVYNIDKTNKDPNNTAPDTADSKKWTVTANWNANGYRLPTEAEWEFAAKGGTQSNGYTYSGSNVVSQVAWYGGKAVAAGDASAGNVTQRGDLRLPASLKANELGLYDMSGNVSEWVWDKYDTTRAGYAASQAGVTENNPTGITGTFNKFVFRGGSSGGPPACMVPAKRFTKDGVFTMCPAGIRLARSVSR